MNHEQTPAQAARQTMRDNVGRYAHGSTASAEQGFSGFGTAGPPDAPTALNDLGMEVGESRQLTSEQHGDPEFGDLTLTRTADGFRVSGGPVVYLGAAVEATDPDHFDADYYMNRNFHRVQAFARDQYGAEVAVPTRGEWSTVQLQFHAEVPADAALDDLPQALARDPKADDLLNDLTADGPGPSEFTRRLARHLDEADRAADRPRNVTVDPDSPFTQEHFDQAVTQARAVLPRIMGSFPPDQRCGMVVTANHPLLCEGPRGLPPVTAYPADSWTPPTDTEHWSSPVGRPVAVIDLDGHVSPIEPTTQH